MDDERLKIASPEDNGAAPRESMVLHQEATRMADIAHFYVQLQGERIGVAGATSLEKQSAARSRTEFMDALAVFSEIADEDSGGGVLEAIHRRLDAASNMEDSAEKVRETARLMKALEMATQGPENTEGLPRYQEWQAQRRKSMQHSAQQDGREAAEADARQREPEVAEAREAIIVAQVMEQAGVAVHAALPREYNANGREGFQISVEARRQSVGGESFGRKIQDDFRIEGALSAESLDRVYGDAGVHEAVAFTPVEAPVYENYEVVERKGLFRQQREARSRIIDTKPVTTGSLIEGGGEEPAVEMVYRTFAGDAVQHPDWAYRTSDGRTGNLLAVSLILPESVARELEQEGRKDPNVIRKIVEQAVLRATQTTPEAWRAGDTLTHSNPVRPPYEAWAEGGRSRMYFKEPGDEAISKDRVVEFSG